MTGGAQAGIDWYDVAPAIVFAIVAGLMSRFIGGSGIRGVVLGTAFIVASGFIAAAAVAYFGVDGVAGLAATTVVWAGLIVPLWRYVQAADRTPVTQLEVDETIALADALSTSISDGYSSYEVTDAAAEVRGHLDHMLWRLPSDSPRRGDIAEAKDRLDRAGATGSPSDGPTSS